jgi:hypothetical protein
MLLSSDQGLCLGNGGEDGGSLIAERFRNLRGGDHEDGVRLAAYRLHQRHQERRRLRSECAFPDLTAFGDCEIPGDFVDENECVG